jgi:hypothetical protein
VHFLQPDEAQTELMKKTAQHVLSAPNAAQLELRILANHGADKRFAFLKGRWSQAWKRIRTAAQKGKEQPATPNTMLGGLTAYSDSDSDSDRTDDGDRDGGTSADTVATKADDTSNIPVLDANSDPPPPPAVDTDEAEKRARRAAKAKEWAEQRRMSKSTGVNTTLS